MNRCILAGIVFAAVSGASAAEAVMQPRAQNFVHVGARALFYVPNPEDDTAFIALPLVGYERAVADHFSVDLSGIYVGSLLSITAMGRAYFFSDAVTGPWLGAATTYYWVLGQGGESTFTPGAHVGYTWRHPSGFTIAPSTGVEYYSGRGIRIPLLFNIDIAIGYSF